MYFENLIPTEAPLYIVPESWARFSEIFKRVHDRMDKLEDALNRSGLRGEVFSKAIRPLMGDPNKVYTPQLDRMSAEEISNAACLMAKGIRDEDCPDRMVWPNCLTMVDTAFVTTKEWEAIRCLGIGGSDSACIQNIGYSSAQEIYYGKIGHPAADEEIDRGLQFIFDFGHKVEPLVIDHFCRRSGAVRVEETRMFAHKDYPFLTANIDQIVKFPDGRIFVFEAKTTTMWNDGEWFAGGIPRQYVPQCHKYPIVLNDDRVCGTYIGCVFGNTPDKFACSLVERNKSVEQDQLETEVRFWNEYVLKGNPPPFSGNAEKDLRITNELIGDADKSLPEVDLDFENLEENLTVYLNLKEKRKQYEEQAKVLKNQMDMLSLDIITALGQATKGSCVCPAEYAPEDGVYEFKASYAPYSKTSVDTERLKDKYPEAYDECVTVNPCDHRVFKLELKKQKKKKLNAS